MEQKSCHHQGIGTDGTCWGKALGGGTGKGDTGGSLGIPDDMALLNLALPPAAARVDRDYLLERQAADVGGRRPLPARRLRYLR
ncbi:hypothetical protein [Rhizobium mongolense]|uniref:hypothetical protein n=1 Tax=Rhizobium mongolense TaxID=57676 RepID=UPI0034A3E99B